MSPVFRPCERTLVASPTCPGLSLPQAGGPIPSPPFFVRDSLPAFVRIYPRDDFHLHQWALHFTGPKRCPLFFPYSPLASLFGSRYTSFQHFPHLRFGQSLGELSSSVSAPRLRFTIVFSSLWMALTYLAGFSIFSHPHQGHPSFPCSTTFFLATRFLLSPFLFCGYRTLQIFFPKLQTHFRHLIGLADLSSSNFPLDQIHNPCVELRILSDFRGL